VRIIDSGSWVCSLMGKAMLSYTDISELAYAGHGS
jgi:hypothetical protein